MKFQVLDPADAEQAIDVVCAAFYDYPVMRTSLCDSGAEYAEHLRALAGFFCRKRLVRGWPMYGVRVGGMVRAVALVSPPTDEPPPPAVAAEQRRLVDRIGGAAFERLARYERESDRDAPREPLYFLGVLATHPDFQGRGLGRVLLDGLAALSERHPRSTGICLNTETADNVGLYEHMGYRVLGKRAVGSMETWCMFRPNRGANADQD